MDNRIPTLQTMLDKTLTLMEGTAQTDYDRPTPCGEYDVLAVMEHVAVWAPVFAAAVNDTRVDFDPTTFVVGSERIKVFASASDSMMAGLKANGFDRMMTMTSDPLPGEFVLNMMLMEYIGHGWDIAQATGRALPYTDHEAAVALTAAQAIIQPQYRGTGMFGQEADAGPNPSNLDKLAAFLGRSPRWSAAG
jgi:uncharacterized protein (TIGR03086 family)